MSQLHPLIPGGKLNGDWFNACIPANIVVGENAKINSSHCFKNYHSQLRCGLMVGENTVFNETSLAVEEGGFLEIGDNCFISSASIVVSKHIKIGNNVFIAGGVTIVDSNFHPLDPVKRLQDIIALSPSGDRKNRPVFAPSPVTIGNNVWIGYNATIMSGITIGDDVIIQPGSVVIKSVPSGNIIGGNPATLLK